MLLCVSLVMPGMMKSSCPTAFIRYWLQMLLAAYHDFEDRSSLLVHSGSAMEQSASCHRQSFRSFTKQHIREWCPNLSDSSIEGAVRTL